MPTNEKPQLKKAILRQIYEENLDLQATSSKAGDRLRARAANARRIIVVSKTVSGSSYFIMLSTLVTLVLFFFYLNGPQEEVQPALATQTQPHATDYVRLQEAPIFSALETRDYLTPDSLVNDASPAIATLFGLQVNTVVIDPGHGGNDTGAVGAGGVKEKDIALDIAIRLRDKLKTQGLFRILLTRDKDTTLSLKKRVQFANRQNADLFISIHVNSLPFESRPFVETYFFGPQSLETSMEFVRRENQHSGYTTGEFKQMITRIHDVFKNQESKILAASIQNTLYRNLKRHNRKLLKGRLKTAPFAVLMDTAMPSVLVETSCFCNKDEAGRLATAQYRDLIALHVGQGIIDYLKKYSSGNTQAVYH